MGIKDLFFNNNDDVYNNFPDAVIVIDFMRNIIVWNKRAELIFGYTKSEIKNKNIMMLFSEDFERFNKIIGLNHGTILRATTKSGENIFVDVTAYDAHSSAKTVIAVRALSNKFLELQNLLDDYQTTKMLVSDRDSFLSNLKFDFSTPLNAAIGFSQSLLDSVCGEINDKQAKYINIINSNNKKVKNLLDKVFEIISLDADKKEFNFKNFELNKIIEYVVNSQKDIAQEKGIKIITSYNLSKKNIFSDEYALAQVFQILLENAVKFSNKGDVVISCEHPDVETLEQRDIKIPLGYSEKSYLKLEVSDCGVGVAEDRLFEIFDEYLSKNLAIAQKYEGTALSLPIARKIIHKLNGSIWCERKSTGGSNFILVIPIERMSFEQ